MRFTFRPFFRSRSTFYEFEITILNEREKKEMEEDDEEGHQRK